MAKNRTVRAAAQPNVSSQKSLFGGASGRWATTQLKAARARGEALTAAVLRTADTLRHDEWKFFDQVIMEEALTRLVGVSDLIAAGLVKNVPNALGKMMFGYEKQSAMDAATTSLDGISRSANDRVESELFYLPLPITHKDFFLNLRALEASKDKGESLDTTQARLAGRAVAEQLENMLFNGLTGKFGGQQVYGYLNAPGLTSTGFGTGGDWGQTAKTGQNILDDVLTMITALQGNRMYGPYWIYVPTDAGIHLNNDFKANGDLTIRERIEAIEGVAAVRVADQLTTSNVVMVQATEDVVSWVQGEPIQTVQWDEYGGFELNFKAFAIGVPLVRDTLAGRSGIYRMTD
jgi:uncharacterized linocin/CFP29 family protein